MADKFRNGSCVLVAALVFLGAAVSAIMAEAADSFALNLLWSTPITAAPASASATTLRKGLGAGLILTAEAAFPDHSVAFLGYQIAPQESSHQERVPVFLPDAVHGRAADAVALKLIGLPCAHDSSVPLRFSFSNLFGSPVVKKVPAPPEVGTLAIGVHDEVWVGGSCNGRVEVSASISDAYLARVDATGQLLWEKIYDGHMSIESMMTMPSGDLAVSGRDYNDGWLARLAPDGTPRWNLRLGDDLGNAVAALPDDRLVLAGFEGKALYVWLIDESGKTIAKTQIRDSIGTLFDRARASIATTNDAIYVASRGESDLDARPVAVAKLQLDGKLLWSTDLPDTIVPVQKAVTTWKTCASALAATPHGDAVVACALDSQIQLYQLDGSSGAYEESRVALPDCQKDRSAKIFLSIKDDGMTLLAGTPPLINRTANCTWIGQLSRSM